MTNIILFLILFVLIVGIWIIYIKLKQIRNSREQIMHDYHIMLDIVRFLGRKAGWYNGGDE